MVNDFTMGVLVIISIFTAIQKVLYYRQVKKLSIRETADATGYSASQICRIQALYKDSESS